MTQARTLHWLNILKVTRNLVFTIIALHNTLISEQGTPDDSTEKPRRRKKPKTPEPAIDGETARENLGYDNEGALDGEDVSVT